MKEHIIPWMNIKWLHGSDLPEAFYFHLKDTVSVLCNLC